MAASREMARVTREIESLGEAIEADIRRGAKETVSREARQALRSEIEACMQRLDELRGRLAG